MLKNLLNTFFRVKFKKLHKLAESKYYKELDQIAEIHKQLLNTANLLNIQYIYPENFPV